MRLRHVLAIATAAAALTACGSSGGGSPRAAASDSGGGTAAAHPSITAQGTGKVTGVPDVLTVSLTAHSEGASAHDTLQANNGLAQQVLDTAKAQGVADEDVATTNVSVGPRYEYPANQQPKLVGFSADESFTVRLKDRAKAGGAIDALSGLGNGIVIQGISYSFDDTSALYAAARADAVKRAAAQAKQLADAAGVSLGGVRTITEATEGGGQPQYAPYDKTAAGAAASVPLAPGSQDLSLVVTVVYDIG